MQNEFWQMVAFEITGVQNPTTGKWFGLIQFSSNGKDFGIAVRKPEWTTAIEAEEFAQEILDDEDSTLAKEIERILSIAQGAAVVNRKRSFTVHEGGRA